MKKILISLAAITAMIPLLTGCLNKEDISVSDQIEMGNVINGEFYNDVGTHLNVISYADCDKNWKSSQRVLFFFDLLKRTDNVPNSYDIRLKQYYPVEIKELVRKSNMDEEAVGNSPINIGSAWISGGFLNIQYEYTYITESNLSHSYNLVLDDTKSQDNKLYFELRHNGHGETLDNLSYEDPSIFSSTFGYASFPISKLIGSTYPQYYFDITWTWHKENEKGLLRETIKNNAQLVLSMEY